MDEHNFFLYLAGVPILGIIAQWLAWRLRLPSILLLLAIGVALGAFVKPDDLLAELAHLDPETASIGPKILFPIVSLSVAIILFEGGLTLRFREIKESAQIVVRLCTVGALVSWVLTSVAAVYLIGLKPGIAALLGAILVVTGPTVVAPMLRQIQPSKRIASLVKWEGIVIDPIGAILAVLVFEFVFAEAGHAGAGDIAWLLTKTALIGTVFGIVAAFLLIQFVKRYWIPDFLHGVMFLTVALGVFVLSNIIQEESGLLTVTVLGIALANQKSISIHHVVEFKEHLRVLLISCLFIVLGSRIEPLDVWKLGIGGVAFLVLMIAVVRPASIFISTIRSNLSIQERIFLSFLAPRGIVAAAVSSVFALKVAGWAVDDNDLKGQADELVALTFLVIIGTVFVYGLFAAPLARRLGLSDPNPQGILFGGAEPWIRQIAKQLQEEGIQIQLVDTNYTNVAAANMDGLNAECASILSEHVQEDLELNGIGRLLALTPNDEVNSLACREFANIFGRANVYQLTPDEAGTGKRLSVASHLRGRLLFGEGLDHNELADRLTHGWVVKKTNLTNEFTYEDFQERYGTSAILLFLVDENKKLSICTADQSYAPVAGQAIIAAVEDNAE